jgi:hypothetical protein
VSTTESEAYKTLAGRRLRGEWLRPDERVRRWLTRLDWLNPTDTVLLRK